ncbi:MAG TPA: hypothetical protein VJ065_03200 [Patescibacteria group bacterium]|nr:hypothetical protein [Patescibacteria group bacterium]
MAERGRVNYTEIIQARNRNGRFPKSGCYDVRPIDMQPVQRPRLASRLPDVVQQMLAEIQRGIQK